VGDLLELHIVKDVRDKYAHHRSNKVRLNW
jgi:hypothetical protein